MALPPRGSIDTPVGTQDTKLDHRNHNSIIVLQEIPDPILCTDGMQIRRWSLSCFLLNLKYLKSEISEPSWKSYGRERAPLAALAGDSGVDFAI